MNAALGIRAGWLIDGGGGALRENVQLEILAGRIQAIESAGMEPPQGAPGRDAEDFSGCTVLPGLVDAHVHLSMSGAAEPERRAAQLECGYEALGALIAENLERHLACGILAVRDGGDRGAFVRRFQREAGAGQRAEPPVVVQSAGCAWHRPGRYGGLIGRAVAPGRLLADALQAADGDGDWVKVVNSGLNSLIEYGRQTPAQFGREELAAAVSFAAGRGSGVMVHANGRQPVGVAVRAGCRSIEHGFFMGRDNLKRMADRQVVWVPTAVTMQAYAGLPPGRGRSPDVARRTCDHQLEQLRLAREHGVAVAVGTDAGSPGVDHGEAYRQEMALLMAAGFPLLETVRCAAQNGARLLGTGAGVLKPGAPASFVAVDGPPSGLPGSLAHVRAVFVNGRAARRR